MWCEDNSVDDDPDQNRILTSSPIGQGLIGKKRGDVVEIKVPMGKLRFEILINRADAGVANPAHECHLKV